MTDSTDRGKEGPEYSKWDPSANTPPTLEQIRNQHEGNLFKNERRDLLLPAGAITLYTIPACLAFLKVHKSILPSEFAGISVVCILSGVAMYAVSAAESGGQDTMAETYSDVSKPRRDWPRTFPVFDSETSYGDEGSLSAEDREILLTEYEVISEEARYRDRLINRSTYFALAVLAGFGTLFPSTEPHQKPALLMVLSLSMYVFAMAIIKYKDARDPLWKRQRDLERLVPSIRGKLTAFHTLRTPPRRSLDKLSMSSFLINVYVAFTAVSAASYAVSVTTLP